MGKVGGIVAPGLEVVEVVVWGTAVQAEGHQAVGGPGQLIATVVLHRQPDVDHEEGQLRQWVAVQQGRGSGGEQPQAKRLPDP